MPSDRGGRPRTEEVRAALTRMMVDDGYYLDHRVQVLALLAECGVGYPIDGLPLPSYEDADLAANGFANLPPDELALIALDPDVLDSVGRLVRWDIPQGDAGGLTLGDWHARAARKYGIRQTSPLHRPTAPPARLANCVEPPTVPGGPEAERRRRRFRASRFNPFRLVSAYPKTTVGGLAACLVLGVGVQQGVAATRESAAINPALDIAEGVRRPKNLAEWDESIRAFEQADAAADHANLFWKVFYSGDRRRLEALRKDYEHAKALRAELIEANRTWLTEGGIATVNDRFVAAFTKLGLFPADRRASAVVSEADQKQLIAFVNSRPTTRRATLAAIDRWLSTLYLSKEAGTTWAESARLLWAATLELEEKDEGRRPSLAGLRRLVDARDVEGLKALFFGPDRLTPDELRRIPSPLFGQVFGCLNSNGEASAARQAAVRYSAVQPHEAVVNGVLVSTASLPVEKRQYAYALTANDPENPLYQNWYGKALFDTGGVDEAAERFERAVRLSDEQGRPFALAHGNLATAYAVLGRPDDAIREYEAALRLAAKPGQQSDDEVDYHYGLAKTLQDSRRDPARVAREAEWCLDWLGRRDATGERYVWSKFILGTALLDLGKVPEAVAALTDGARLRPRLVGEALLRVKRYSTAATVLREVLAAEFKDLHAKHPDYPVDELTAREPLTLLAVAALARAGRTGDVDQPKDAKNLTAAAVTWGKSLLRGLSARYERVKAGRGGDTRLDLLHTMDQYQMSGLLAAVRDPAMRNELPAGEQRAWEEFWKGLNELHAKVRALPPDPETGRPSRLGDF